MSENKRVATSDGRFDLTQLIDEAKRESADTGDGTVSQTDIAALFGRKKKGGASSAGESNDG